MGKTLLALAAGPAFIVFVRLLWLLAAEDRSPFQWGHGQEGAGLIVALALAASGAALVYRFFPKGGGHA